ncbi:hypothetical protein Stsp01_50530 [Streptomyces sp. NBRC 13847]|nr:hypothetical protein Stsp01_50530 [Streptomyces sp. NBRC 13847]
MPGIPHQPGLITFHRVNPPCVANPWDVRREAGRDAARFRAGAADSAPAADNPAADACAASAHSEPSIRKLCHVRRLAAEGDPRRR